MYTAPHINCTYLCHKERNPSTPYHNKDLGFVYKNAFLSWQVTYIYLNVLLTQRLGSLIVHSPVYNCTHV